MDFFARDNENTELYYSGIWFNKFISCDNMMKLKESKIPNHIIHRALRNFDGKNEKYVTFYYRSEYIIYITYSSGSNGYDDKKGPQIEVSKLPIKPNGLYKCLLRC